MRSECQARPRLVPASAQVTICSGTTVTAAISAQHRPAGIQGSTCAELPRKFMQHRSFSKNGEPAEMGFEHHFHLRFSPHGKLPRHFFGEWWAPRIGQTRCVAIPSTKPSKKSWTLDTLGSELPEKNRRRHVLMSSLTMPAPFC